MPEASLPRGRVSSPGLLKSALTLLAAGTLAQLIPLLLGPWLTRIYTPEAFGVYHLFAAVAANVGVVACARYEFALPKSADEEEARALRTLCLRLIVAAIGLCFFIAIAWSWFAQAVWPLWLPAAVGSLGLVSLATLEATRTQRVLALAWARVLQHGGGAALQGAAGVLQLGVHGLLFAPILATLAALGALGGTGTTGAPRSQWRAAAHTHRDFPLLNTPHAFIGALQDTLAVVMIASSLGAAAAGVWGLALRYLKAPATLVGGAVSQALYPQLAQAGCTLAGRRLVVQTMGVLMAIAAPLVVLLWLVAPPMFSWAFGTAWRDAGDLASALALYIGLHFVASPLGVVTLAWNAQAWALKLALVGQVAFVGALGTGLAYGGLRGAGWAVSATMLVYFAWYFFSLARWPVEGA